MDKRITSISPEAMALLAESDWPGNVRELSNAIERAMVVGRAPAILPRDLPVPSRRRRAGEANGADESLEQVERRHIATVLQAHDWNITHAAHVLGIDRVTVYNKIRKYKLRRPTRPPRVESAV
jgi:DNA-binding NtrC family response regulator